MLLQTILTHIMRQRVSTDLLYFPNFGNKHKTLLTSQKLMHKARPFKKLLEALALEFKFHRAFLHYMCKSFRLFHWWKAASICIW